MTELLSPELISVESRRFGLAFLNWTFDLLQWFLLWFSITQTPSSCGAQFWEWTIERPLATKPQAIRPGVRSRLVSGLLLAALNAVTGVLNHVATALSTPWWESHHPLCHPLRAQDSARRRSINWLYLLHHGIVICQGRTDLADGSPGW